MNMYKLIKYFMIYLIFMSLCVLIIGLYETTRNEMFDIVENQGILNASNTPTDIYDDYLDFKTQELYTNSPYIKFLNYLGMIMLFFIYRVAWKEGQRSFKFDLNDIFISYGIVLVFLLYFFLIIINYLINIFVNQLLIVLFNDIYLNVYMYSVFVENIVFFILVGYFITWLSNQIKYFEP